MIVNQETVQHLADLSNFALTDDESQRLIKDINNIIDYISQLDSLNTNDIEPTYQVFEMSNVWREDKILPQDASPDELLRLSKSTQQHQIKVPQVI